MKRKAFVRITCFILCLILTISGAYATSRDLSFEESIAARLKGLGLFRGVSDTDFDLGRAPTRIEALVMLIRTLGQEQNALNGEWSHPFTDVPKWADKYVGYAYTNNLTNGVSSTEFGMSNANASAYLTFILRALGYSDVNGTDFVWNDPFALASELGILPGIVNTRDFLRADAVIVSYAALDVKLKNSSQTLAEKLIATNTFTYAQYNQYYDNSILHSTNELPQVTFKTAAELLDRLISEAKNQYYSEEYTALAEPVKYNILWLGFTHVTYGELDFQMTDFDKDYLNAVTLNFEKAVESITNHNLDISVDLHFVDEVTPLTKVDNDEWLYLAQETAQSIIDHFATFKDYDTVLTTVQTAGTENQVRNQGKEGYGVHYVMLGLETAGLASPIGYSTFDLSEPKPGTYPLADPTVPSLFATAVAVHEWMHQLEYMGTLLGIEYPNTHAYMGPSEFPGYQKYTADENDYDFFEFYKLVLQGKLPYTKDGVTKHVGMYPKMWQLVKRDLMNLGTFTIQSVEGYGYLTGQRNDPSLTLSNTACIWNIRYGGDGRFILSPAAIPEWRIDLSNAWDSENNTVGLWYDTGYVDAQTWFLKENADGSFCIQTPYESGRVITVPDVEQSAVIRHIGSEGIQNWFIKPVSFKENKP